MSEYFELYYDKLNIGITKSNSSASSIVAPSIFTMRLVNDAQYLNATQFALMH